MASREELLEGKVAVITGASSGIGAAIARNLLLADLIVVGLARRVERVHELKQGLLPEQQQRLHVIRCDVGKEEEVAAAFSQIANCYGVVHILINNAGCMRPGQLCTQDAIAVQEVLQTNVMGVVNCTRHAFAAMRAHNGEGQVILINSILGHHVPVIQGQLPSFGIYPASKFALSAINEVYRQEFKELGTRIKVTSISPGLVNTELITEQSKAGCGGVILQPEDVARAVMFVIRSPHHVQIYELTMKPLNDII